ncbi:MAG: UDP-glucuronic acid decarboxylase family protein [Candidatus Nanohalobium sp.]
MRVLLTGGAGFIGSHLTEKLLEQGNEVIVVDDLSSGQASNIEHLKNREDFEFRDQDVLDDLEIDGELDYVLHFASRASPNDYQEHPIHTLRTNSEGTLKMLELADEHDAKFMYSSTSEVYGNPEEHPQTEEYNGNVNPVGPRACYDEGKRFGEAAIVSYDMKHSIDYRIIRIFNTYGPRLRKEDGRVISNFLDQALNDRPLTVYGDGTQTRSFCYIDDLVNGIREAMDSEKGEIFNLGNPDEYTILELAEKVQEVIETESEITHQELPEDDPEKRKPDISKAREKLGWEPEVSLEKGLKQTAEYLRTEYQ